MRTPIRHLALPLALVAMLLVAGCNMLGGGSGELVGPTWQWTASTTTAPASQSVTPDPENYTITFANDGTYSGKADCNNIAGTYTASGSTLTIKPGPSTMAACPEGSQDAFYVAGLLATQSYAITNGELVLTTTDGTMTFKKG